MALIIAAQMDQNRKVTAFARLDESMVSQDPSWVACPMDQDMNDPAAWEVNAAGELVPNQARLVTEDMIRDEGARRLRVVAARYRGEERETWHVQIERATAFLAAPVGSEPAVPMLDAMAAANGTTARDWAMRITTNAALFEAAAGHILGRQDALIAMDPRPHDYADNSHW